LECKRSYSSAYSQLTDWALLQFEELVEQFIPSDPTWKGWVKMALHQPFFEVIPVARELISKTKRIASKSVQQSTHTITPRRQKPTKTSERSLPKTKGDSGGSTVLSTPLTDEPEAMSPVERPKIPPQIAGHHRSGSSTRRDSSDRDRVKVTSMFRRKTMTHSRNTSSDKVSAFPVLSSQLLTLGAGHRIIDILGAQHRQQRQSHEFD